MKRIFRALLGAGLTVAMASGAVAQERGPVTGLQIPRFVSLKSNEGNVRRGPGLTHRVDWVFKRRDMPLMVTAEYEHWRRVQDADGAGGWIHFALLSGARTVLVEQEMATLYLQADARAPVVARLEAGVVGEIDQCVPSWCRIRAGGQRGWVETAALWGVTPGEVIE